MTDADCDGIRISYDETQGTEPALLLLPGWCVDRSAFDRLRQQIAGQRTIALDWQGHGRSGAPQGDFGTQALVRNALAVLESSGADRVIPVAQAHAGWVAVELRRRLGERVPALVLLSWLVLDPPPPFLGVLQAMQRPEDWMQARDKLFGMWTQGVHDPEILQLVRSDMAKYGHEMWARASREIEASYSRHGTALEALSRLNPPPDTLHLYSLPPDEAFLQAQRQFAAEHRWFRVGRIEGNSHFPMMENPAAVTAGIRSFLAEPGLPA